MAHHTVDDFKVGDLVVCIADRRKRVTGVVVSKNHEHVFVRYGGPPHWPQATCPSDLEYAAR